MRTEGVTAAITEEARKTLHNLQPTATDKENLVGAGRVLRSSAKAIVKQVPMLETTIKPEPPKKENSKSTRKSPTVNYSNAGKQIKIIAEDLTSEAGPSENYWQVLAERRRKALEDALEENKKLNERILKLEDEKRIYREMLEETRNVVEILQEMIGEDRSNINNSLEDSEL